MKIPPFKLERFFAQYEFNVRYLLCSSDCESMSIDQLLTLDSVRSRDEILNDFIKLHLGYTETKGNPVLRKAITSLYRTDDIGTIITFTGAQEAIFIVLNSILKSMDHVIVMSPAYQSLYQIPKALNCKVDFWEGHDENGQWIFDTKKLKQLIKKSTKCIIINTPHNPTGFHFSIDEINDIVWICRNNGIWLFSDEVYRGLEYNESAKLPSITDLYEFGISLGVLSKAYGLAGLRVGWIYAKDFLVMSQLVSMKDYITICSSAPSEFLATVALNNFEKIQKRNIDIIHNNLEILNDFFSLHADLFVWNAPLAGSIAFPKLLNTKSSEQFCVDLVKAKNVLLAPSKFFNSDDKHFRIGFGRKNMQEALKVFEQYINEKK